MVTYLGITWNVTLVVVLLLGTAVCGQGKTAKSLSKDTCDKQRKILSGSSGIFSDGSSDYPEDSHCEWLIKANSSKQYITLTFLEMETECSYDHIFVYNGDSYTSPLLGSFSGSTVPPPITAHSGAMLVLLYSDTNYVRKGFRAIYNITDCPLNCSQRGQCVGSICQCDHLWTGDACDIPLCPNNCGINEDTGDCNMYVNPPQCICNQGYSGESCNLPESNQNGGNSWHLLTRDRTNLSPRAGVAGIYVSHVDRFYLFGGFTFGSVLGDLLSYNFNGSKWLKHRTSFGPVPRWGHAIAPYAKNFVLYGGELENGILSDELWLYNVAKEEWQLEARQSTIRPPALTKHSLTLVEGKWLYLFGGSMQDGSFSSDMYRINLNEGAQWEKIEPLGGKELERRIVGHSTVYHAATKSLFVYGGIMVDYARFSRLSNQIHAFHVDKQYWTQIVYPKSGTSVPFERAFHSAAIVGDYLVIYGGYTHRHSLQEICYDNEIYLYHLGCHKWVDFDILGINKPSKQNPITQGVIAHAMGIRRGHTLLIAGGYSGMIRGTLLAYVMPPVVTARGQQLPLSACSSSRTKENCTAYPSCSWCSQNGQGFCLEKSMHKECRRGTFSASVCPGLCPALRDCHSCLIWGEASGPNSIGNIDTMDPFLQPTCSWCVQAAQCHPVRSPPDICRTVNNVSDPISKRKWWGLTGTDISTIIECRTKDLRPGFISLKYRHPVNWSQPDSVSYINETKEEFQMQTEFSREREGLDGGENLVRFSGFIHPLGATPLHFSDQKSNLRLVMGFSGARAILQLSNDSSKDHLEVVANNTSNIHVNIDARRPGDLQLFPNTAVGHKYLVDFRVSLPVAYNESVTMQLLWNAFIKQEQLENISFSYLEPYNNGSCDEYRNCLACLSDAACGWCQQTLECMQRKLVNAQHPFCPGDYKHSYIITVPENCPVCSNYIYCEDCAKIQHCEWLVEEAHCGRRGRFEDAVRHPDLCPTPCHLRFNCTSCLGDPGHCAWCEETHTCFLFATYTTSFMFGRCREWVDEDRSAPSGVTTPGAQCRDCGRHTDCKTCLKDLSCGWCGNRHNPTIGVCVHGDFSGPHIGKCELLVAQAYPNILSSEPTDWSYSSCPDVEECWLGLHTCHPNATCINNPTSYTCTCNHGFKGNGITDCVRTCLPECIHGYCSESPDYVCMCKLGWTGEDCNINCGCHYHSNCSKGVAVCDECQDWTEGQFCERCRAGSFGNATTTAGCKKCNCNGHANVSAGYCRRTTGECYCQNNTEGPNCEHCKAGYYGDPRDGGQCYLECQPRGIITDVQKGLLGSQVGATYPFYCLWILTVHPFINKTSISKTVEVKADIQLTIHSDMKIKCPHNHLYVYDGFPKFILPDHPGKILGSYCGMNLSQPLTLIASSGYMTVYFRRTNPVHGFNATYQRLSCPHLCSIPYKTCYGYKCACKQGFVGSTCNKEICPNKCSGHGKCHKMNGTCSCVNGFGGQDCSVSTEYSHVLWTVLFDPEMMQQSYNNLKDELPRMGHTLLASRNPHSPTSALLWVFGGYSATFGNLNDIYMYNDKQNSWKKILLETEMKRPPARHFHCAAIAGGDIYMYGGLGDEEVLGDFWKFSIPQRTWTELMTPPELPALAGATLTLVNNSKLVLIGGFSPNYGFFEKVVEYDIESKEWQIINYTSVLPIGIYGHTTVYHSLTKALYVFGGVIYNTDHLMISNDLYAFHCFPVSRWSRLPANPPDNKPPPTSFHAAVITDSYMVVLAGRTDKDNELIKETYAYLFKCNLWFPLKKENISVSGQPLSPVVGISAVLWSGQIYAFGGFDGQMSGRLTKLSIPHDLCHLFSKMRSECILHIGCSYCSVAENHINKTFCYSQHGIIPSSCYSPKKQSEVTPGVACTAEWMERRDCYQYLNCIDCVASWPSHPDAKQVCKWCSNCQEGHCIPASSTCNKADVCSVPEHVVKYPSVCPKNCLASDCEKCGNLPGCMWTRHALRKSNWEHTLNENPIYDWTCVKKMDQDPRSFPVKSMPPLTCPPHCSQHHNCSTCLDSPGGEGGWHECHWNEALQQCISPSFELLQCEGGACGAVLQGSSSSCPVPCWQHTQAALCLSYPHCGWCAFSGRKVNGRGLCMRGGLLRPVEGMCDGLRFNARPLPENASKWFKQSDGHVSWHYLQQPPENECLNGHHDCDDHTQECIDTKEKYICKCKQGYVVEGKNCKPVCVQGCMFGTCIEPNKCKCHFGYVGHNCSIQCDCNGHSNCEGPEHLSNCLKCHNNTQGSQCQQCKPLFVGSPINGGKCIPCRMYCNGHSDICISSEFLNSSSANVFSHQWEQYLTSEYLIKEGPKDDAICLNCQNNTENNRCDQCIPGFFKVENNIQDGCRLCECHGHGDMCNPLNGENCNCQNNTETDRQCGQKSNKNSHPCWQLQCSKCKEYFLGTPIHGHQCYRHMFLDKDYCFDPNTQEECIRKPSPLLQGRTVFFAVQPRYMNVDIRIMVDVTEGGVDFYLSPKEDTFLIDVNKTTGIHSIIIDRKYGIEIGNSNYEEHQANLAVKDKKIGKREIVTNDVISGSNSSDVHVSSTLKPNEATAKGLTSYITITDPQVFLCIRKLENRLVITIPQEVHELRSTRFYMVLHGIGSKASNLTYGNIFFRQDQTRIDLFVFFSVFFSCFFLFLAICVVIWKVKQAFDVRRARRLHAAEMKHMASRPFARIITVIEDEPDDYDFYPYSPNNYRKKHKHKCHLARDSPKVYSTDRFGTKPIAIEPRADGIAAIATVLVQLPGGLSAPVRLSLGTALITVRGLSSHGNIGIRAPRRRRTSHITL